MDKFQYENDPDDGHDHEWTAEGELPDTGSADGETAICSRCGMLTFQEHDLGEDEEE